MRPQWGNFRRRTIAPKDSRKLRWTLQRFGYSESAIDAAWPGWWSDDAEGSLSAQNELRFSLARKLGLDPRTLLADEEPQFVWKRKAKFKNLTGQSDQEREVISAYGMSIGRVLTTASAEVQSLVGTPAGELRRSILATQPFVRLQDLLGLCWGVGIPVAHLRVFPLSAKRMCAMSVRTGTRYSVLLGRDAEYPAPIAFYLAHELGHIAQEHLREEASAVVDLADPLEEGRDVDVDVDVEELNADAYALELLTGEPAPKVTSTASKFTAAQLADNVLQTGPQLHIEPGTLALVYGHTTKDWPKVQAALRIIYQRPTPVWSEVNRIAAQQLEWAAIADDLQSFVRTVIPDA